VGLPMCTWNDVKEYCSPSHHVYLSIKAAPTTVLHRWAGGSFSSLPRHAGLLLRTCIQLGAAARKPLKPRTEHCCAHTRCCGCVCLCPPRAAAVAYDRNLVCNGRPDEALCVNATAQRCFWWNKSCVGLDAYEVCGGGGGEEGARSCTCNACLPRQPAALAMLPR
jgi:hypothetical protein